MCINLIIENVSCFLMLKPFYSFSLPRTKERSFFSRPKTFFFLLCLQFNFSHAKVWNLTANFTQTEFSFFASGPFFLSTFKATKACKGPDLQQQRSEKATGDRRKWLGCNCKKSWPEHLSLQFSIWIKLNWFQRKGPSQSGCFKYLRYPNKEFDRFPCTQDNRHFETKEIDF